VTQWLKALARLAHQQCGGPGVGAIGMCFTRNFALTMMLDPSMLAPVLSSPHCRSRIPLVSRSLPRTSGRSAKGSSEKT